VLTLNAPTTTVPVNCSIFTMADQSEGASSSSPPVLAPFRYLHHPRYRDVVTNLDENNFTAGVRIEYAKHPEIFSDPCWNFRLRLQYAFGPNASCCVHDLAASQEITERFSRKQVPANSVGEQAVAEESKDSKIIPDSLFVVGEIVEGMNGCYFRYTYAEYQEMVASSKALMGEGKGKLLQRLRLLETEKELVLATYDFYQVAVAYLLRKASRHGVQVEFKDEWEYFLCAKVFEHEDAGRKRLVKVNSSPPVAVAPDTMQKMTNAEARVEELC